MAESKLRELSTDFAVKVIKLCDNVKGHYSLVNQLERSSTSIGANIHEANYAHSKADFVAKFQIALKECYPSRRIGMESTRPARCMEPRQSRAWHCAKRV